MTALAALGRHAPAFLVSGLALGLAAPEAASLARPFLEPLVFLLTVCSLLRVDVAALREHGRRPWTALLGIAISLVGSPLLMAGFAAALPGPPAIEHLLILWAASPPLMAAPALAFVLGLDATLTLLVTIVALLASPLTLPPIALEVLGVALPVGSLDLFLRLGAFVAGSIGVAAAVAWAMGSARLRRLGPEIGGAQIFLLAIFAVGVMDGMRGHLADRPVDVALAALGTLGGSLCLNAVVALAFAGGGRHRALTMGHVAGNQNFAVVWANLGSAQTAEATMFLAAAQLPVYLLPALLRPLYRRLLPAAPQAVRNG